jgi:hypothetical protein
MNNFILFFYHYGELWGWELEDSDTVKNPEF